MSVAEIINKILKTLPVGFRFHPTDEELVDHYLKSMVLGTGSPTEIIPVVEVCKREPEDLPGLSMIKTGDPDWFFFCPVDYKNSNCSQHNRQTGAGYWKPTGNDREIKSGNNKIGTKKTLVFHRGRGRSARRTHWVIHEYQYRPDFSGVPSNKAYVLCHLMRKTDENASPDVLIPGEAAAGTDFGNGMVINNMGFGAGSSNHPYNIGSEIGNYQLEEMALDEDPELQGLLHETRFPPLGDDMFAQSEQVVDSDLWSPPGLIHSHGTGQFQNGDDAEFADTLFIDEDGFPCRGAFESGNQRRGSISKLSAQPKSPLRGTYVDSGVSISGSNTQMLRVKETSGRGVPNMMELTKSPVAQQQHTTAVSLSIMPQVSVSIESGNKSVATQKLKPKPEVPPKISKLEGNDPKNEILVAKLAKLSCNMPKPDEKPVLGKAKDGVECGTAIDQPQNKNPIRESKKECEVAQKENPKLSSVIRWNEPVKPEAGSGSDDPSSSPPELINFVVGIVLLVILIVVMVLDIMALR